MLIYVPSLFTNIQLFKENIITKNVLKRIGLFSNPLVKSKWSEYDRNKYIYLVFVTSIPLHTKLDHLFTINLASLSKFEQVLTQFSKNSFTDAANNYAQPYEETASHRLASVL